MTGSAKASQHRPRYRESCSSGHFWRRALASATTLQRLPYCAMPQPLYLVANGIQASAQVILEQMNLNHNFDPAKPPTTPRVPATSIFTNRSDYIALFPRCNIFGLLRSCSCHLHLQIVASSIRVYRVTQVTSPSSRDCRPTRI